MSEIPVSSIVDVQITTTPTAPSRAGFGVMLVVTQELGVISPLEGVRYYNSIDEVAADWASTTEVNKAATAYFSQSPSPDTLAIGVRYVAAQAGFLQSSGNAESAFAVWAAVSDGTFTISIDGVSEDLTGVDFTGDLDMDDVAATIQTKLQAVASGGYTAATCVWDSVATVFIITSGTTGATSSVDYMTAEGTGTDISGAGEAGDADAFFQGRQGQASKQIGLAAESDVQDALSRLDEGQDWYSFAFTKETRDDQDSQDAAAWAEARIKQFYTVTNNEDSVQAAVETDIGFILNALAYRRTFVIYSTNPDQYPEVSAFARAATVDFSFEDSTITMKFKQLPGINTESVTSGQATVLRGKGVNVYVNVGSSPMLQEGMMVKGIGTWQDTVHGVDWLTNAIETNVFGRLYQATTKVPLTDEGGQILNQQVVLALDEGVKNGLIAPGTDINGNFLPLGYSTSVQPVSEISAGDKSARKGPNISFVAIGAGAIHSIEIAGVFEG